jgi:hypothetical protein
MSVQWQKPQEHSKKVNARQRAKHNASVMKQLLIRMAMAIEVANQRQSLERHVRLGNPNHLINIQRQ